MQFGPHASRCRNKALRNHKINFTVNFTTHFGPTAAEIERIVKLIANIKRNIFVLFVFTINFTIGSISAA